MITHNQGIKKIQSNLKHYTVVITTSAFAFGIGYLVSPVMATDPVAQQCIKQQSQYWNELELMKQDTQKNLINEITHIQTGMANNNKSNKDGLGL